MSQLRGIPRPDHSAPSYSDGSCCVSGCQLPGTLASETSGAKEWYCRLHFGAQYSEYGAITAMANNRIDVYRLAFRCSNAGPNLPIPRQLREALHRLGRDDLLEAKSPIEGRELTVRTLGKHMLNTLDAECVNRQKDLEKVA